MEIKGKIKSIDETKEYGSNGFTKRDLVLTTDEQYPQNILVEFVQDKCDVLNTYNVGEEVKIGINIKGREWSNKDNQVKYFNSIQGWFIEKVNGVSDNDTQITGNPPPPKNNDDLPF